MDKDYLFISTMCAVGILFISIASTVINKFEKIAIIIFGFFVFIEAVYSLLSVLGRKEPCKKGDDN